MLSTRLPFSALALLITATLVNLGAAQHTCSCGKGSLTVNYTATDVNNAISTATRGSYGGYPHTFNNFERISFPLCTGAVLKEFPVKKGTAYTGGAPGADRVIYKATNSFCGCITHNGAVGNNFVSCTWT